MQIHRLPDLWRKPIKYMSLGQIDMFIFNPRFNNSLFGMKMNYNLMVAAEFGGEQNTAIIAQLTA